MKLPSREAFSIPQLHPQLNITQGAEGDLLLEHGSYRQQFKGREAQLARQLITQINGENTVASILTQLEADWSQSEVLAFVRQYGPKIFYERKAQTEASPASPKPLLTLLGVGALFEALEKALAPLPVDVSTAGASYSPPKLLIFVVQTQTLTSLDSWIQKAYEDSFPILFISEIQGKIWLGPSFLPGISNGWDCVKEQFDLSEADLSSTPGSQIASSTLSPAIQKVIPEVGKLLGAHPGSNFQYLNKVSVWTGTSSQSHEILAPPDSPSGKKDLATQPNLLQNKVWARALTELSFSGVKGRPESRIRRDRDWAHAHPDRTQTVGILGGGTAGYLTAVALKRRFPHLKISLIESSSVPIIGVGEATTPLLNFFLFKILGINIQDFYQKVRPTWKLGIRFFWGLPGDHFFNHPFGLADIFPAWRYSGDINQASLTMMMMAEDRAPVMQAGGEGQFQSLLHRTPHALHLDNKLFVTYLQDLARQAGVEHIDATIASVQTTDNGEEIKSLQAEDGRQFSYDLYVDCSGFKSLLMGQALGSPFESYAPSLFTDRAVVGHVPHGGKIKPYTLADSMQHGWCWGIPLRDSDHRGYVYSSAFCSDEEALAEMKRLNPEIGPTRLVKFCTGRRQHFWKGNVVAIGNAYGFVEPLESTGIHMIIQEIMDLADHFPELKTDTARRSLLNRRQNANWDFLRWFLAIHYKFNHKYDSPFWKACQEETDVSGVEDLISMYRETGPLSYQDKPTQDLMSPFKEDIIFGPFGFDLMLLGQGVDPGQRSVLPDEGRTWKQRHRVWQQMMALTLPQEEALAAIDRYPSLLG